MCALNNSIRLTQFSWIQLIYSFSRCAYPYSVWLVIQFNSFLSCGFSLWLSEYSYLTTTIPFSSSRHSLTTSTPHSAGPTGTHTNSVCLSSLDGHGIGKGMGNCLFIPSEGKIEYRNPCLLPGVGFTEALAASFTHSIPLDLTLAGIKKYYSRNPADSCLFNTQPYKHTHGHRGVWHTIVCFPLMGRKDDKN